MITLKTFPVPSMEEANNHMADKVYFSKLDCSQAYHVVKMADERSVQLLAFNFESRTFAYQRLAQGLNRSATARIHKQTYITTLGTTT